MSAGDAVVLEKGGGSASAIKTKSMSAGDAGVLEKRAQKALAMETIVQIPAILPEEIKKMILQHVIAKNIRERNMMGWEAVHNNIKTRVAMQA